MTVARWLRCASAAGILTCALVVPVQAIVNPGQVAPEFIKNVLNSTPWATASLSQFAGKVVVLHILGYD